MPRALVSLSLLCLLSFTARSRADEKTPADDGNVASAARHFQAGMTHFNLEEWDQAIVEFEAGYRAKPAPEFLYNLAQAYRLSKRPDKAIGFYRRFLYTLPPDDGNRETIERQIASCQQESDAQKSAAGNTTPTADPASAKPSSSDSVASVIAAPPPRRPRKRAWIWGVVAGATAVVAGAVVLGVVLGTRGDGQQSLMGVQF